MRALSIHAVFVLMLAGCGAGQSGGAQEAAADSGGGANSGAVNGQPSGAGAGARSDKSVAGNGAAASARAPGAGARAGQSVGGVGANAGVGSAQPAAGAGAVAATNAGPAAGAGAGIIAGVGAASVAGAGAGIVAGAGATAAAGSGGHPSAGGAGVMSPNTMPAGDYHPCPSDGTACKIMPFGDSITDGYNQDTPGGYRVELFRLAHSAGKTITFVGTGSNGPDKVDGAAFPHNHEGHSGWTIAPAGGRSGISTLVSSVMPQHKPHIVLLMIGTNDAIDNYEMAKAPTRLGELIDSIYAQLPDVLIVVASLIPARGDRGQGDDAELNARIMSFNTNVPATVKKRADAGKHILQVDMHKPFEADARPLLEDQWHPNLAGYVLIGAEWYKTLQPLL